MVTYLKKFIIVAIIILIIALLWKDSDGDGVINYFDYNDRDPYIQNPYQYSFPSYKRRLHLLPRYKRGYYWNYRYHPY